ncbi:beta-ketoacyl synthase N-terminal-like domain-containing protein [Rathayibacter tritici]|uniref:Polyketide beta-ketoacyl:ACP synthase n=1 Tax=Rathayibacter tritici TaxID=33888 RepID=A0A169BVM8_9MICO|nr:beta-ketoacyl synthase N-terminal-like domain-containing protein [Rathayibacter tritici]AND15931.1 polyketide beta-ketoacyl:ACP synthase [Rathayibacter tritici]PPI41068.1 polyketide beta-ketoacyl:ACP synthase [Rathayibacter tritici]
MVDGGSLVVSGLGVSSAVGVGKVDFARGLFAGRGTFTPMSRPGRQHGSSVVGAEMADPLAGRFDELPSWSSASLTARVAVATLDEAWQEARLDSMDADRMGLVVGGSNVQQRESLLARERQASDPRFVRPRYGMSVWDTDVSALCSEVFGIRGFAHTVGGASASGGLAVAEAAEAVQSGRVDICVAVGALADISYWEVFALQSMGAMAPDGTDVAPRPFDVGSRGFVFGESCAAIVLERPGGRCLPSGERYARLAGWAVRSDAHRGPDPSLEGEAGVLHDAVAAAGLEADDIDYVNTHGSGAPLGDRTEVGAIRRAGLEGAALNATKAITGHGLTAAGTVEAVATLLQMEAGLLHPTAHLEEPIDPELRWVGPVARSAELRASVSTSVGFGGISTALCFATPTPFASRSSGRSSGTDPGAEQAREGTP